MTDDKELDIVILEKLVQELKKGIEEQQVRIKELEARMTDDKEERTITKEQYVALLVGDPCDCPTWDSLPDAPEHTDEEYDALEKQLTELIKTYEEWRGIIANQKARIKELENLRPCPWCGKSLYVNNPYCPTNHTARLGTEAKKTTKESGPPYDEHQGKARN